MLENSGGKMNITIELNADGVIFKMYILILANQNVFAVFFCKIFAARSEKHDINIYRWEGC